MALGPIVLGHNYKSVNNALQKRLKKGIAFSLPNKLEVELSKYLIDWFPFAESVRFGKNGSDVTSAAVRAARAYTNKEHILCCGYHGWQDWFIGTTTRNKGVPNCVKKLTHSFKYNDIETFNLLIKNIQEKLQGIIIEPIGLEKPTNNFLKEIRKQATKNNIVLIFDECWTGFRIMKKALTVNLEYHQIWLALEKH